MNVLQITSHLNVGGVSRSILDVTRGLRARGHAVRIASGGGQLVAEAKQLGAIHWEVPLHTSVEFSPRVLWAAWRLVQLLRRDPVDLLHGHTRVGQVVAALLSWWFNLPYVTTWHGFFRPNPGRQLWPCSGRTAIAISEPVRYHMIHRLGLAPERVRVIPHGIDPAPYEMPVASSLQDALRRQVGLRPRGPVIGTVARLVASKHVDQLIRSLPTIRAGAPAAQLLLVGDGPQRQGLERLARSLQVQDAVRFAGALAETRVALSLMDVFVFLPADEEGFGLALLEAMASARPIVSVRQGGGAIWVLEQSHVGQLVSPGDPDALAAAVLHYVRDGALASQAADQARAAVKERFAFAPMMDAVEAVYAGAITAP
jgi:glycosyltransferase involved in cell wall biosynthesis